MKYIHGGTIKGRVSGGAVVRVIFGAILAFFSLVFFVAAIVSGNTNTYAMLCVYSILMFWPGAFLLLFFGIRSLCKTTKGYPRHDASQMLPMDMNNLFFTVRCEKCGLGFDYQCSDLGFRAWYRDGYVECPRCRQPVRHSATANTFKVEEINY